MPIFKLTSCKDMKKIFKKFYDKHNSRVVSSHDTTSSTTHSPVYQPTQTNRSCETESPLRYPSSIDNASRSPSPQIWKTTSKRESGRKNTKITKITKRTRNVESTESTTCINVGKKKDMQDSLAPIEDNVNFPFVSTSIETTCPLDLHPKQPKQLRTFFENDIFDDRYQKNKNRESSPFAEPSLYRQPNFSHSSPTLSSHVEKHNKNIIALSSAGKKFQENLRNLEKVHVLKYRKSAPHTPTLESSPSKINNEFKNNSNFKLQPAFNPAKNTSTHTICEHSPNTIMHSKRSVLEDDTRYPPLKNYKPRSLTSSVSYSDLSKASITRNVSTPQHSFLQRSDYGHHHSREHCSISASPYSVPNKASDSITAKHQFSKKTELPLMNQYQLSNSITPTQGLGISTQCSSQNPDLQLVKTTGLNRLNAGVYLNQPFYQTQKKPAESSCLGISGAQVTEDYILETQTVPAIKKFKEPSSTNIEFSFLSSPKPLLLLPKSVSMPSIKHSTVLLTGDFAQKIVGTATIQRRRTSSSSLCTKSTRDTVGSKDSNKVNTNFTEKNWVICEKFQKGAEMYDTANKYNDRTTTRSSLPTRHIDDIRTHKDNRSGVPQSVFLEATPVQLKNHQTLAHTPVEMDRGFSTVSISSSIDCDALFRNGDESPQSPDARDRLAASQVKSAVRVEVLKVKAHEAKVENRRKTISDAVSIDGALFTSLNGVIRLEDAADKGVTAVSKVEFTAGRPTSATKNEHSGCQQVGKSTENTLKSLAYPDLSFTSLVAEQENRWKSKPETKNVVSTQLSGETGGLKAVPISTKNQRRIQKWWSLNDIHKYLQQTNEITFGEEKQVFRAGAETRFCGNLLALQLASTLASTKGSVTKPTVVYYGNKTVVETGLHSASKTKNLQEHDPSSTGPEYPFHPPFSISSFSSSFSSSSSSSPLLKSKSPNWTKPRRSCVAGTTNNNITTDPIFEESQLTKFSNNGNNNDLTSLSQENNNSSLNREDSNSANLKHIFEMSTTLSNIPLSLSASYHSKHKSFSNKLTLLSKKSKNNLVNAEDLESTDQFHQNNQKKRIASQQQPETLSRALYVHGNSNSSGPDTNDINQHPSTSLPRRSKSRRLLSRTSITINPNRSKHLSEYNQQSYSISNPVIVESSVTLQQMSTTDFEKEESILEEEIISPKTSHQFTFSNPSTPTIAIKPKPTLASLSLLPNSSLESPMHPRTSSICYYSPSAIPDHKPSPMSVKEKASQSSTDVSTGNVTTTIRLVREDTDICQSDSEISGPDSPTTDSEIEINEAVSIHLDSPELRPSLVQVAGPCERPAKQLIRRVVERDSVRESTVGVLGAIPAAYHSSSLATRRRRNESRHASMSIHCPNSLAPVGIEIVRQPQLGPRSATLPVLNHYFNSPASSTSSNTPSPLSASQVPITTPSNAHMSKSNTSESLFSYYTSPEYFLVEQQQQSALKSHSAKATPVSATFSPMGRSFSSPHPVPHSLPHTPHNNGSMSITSPRHSPSSSASSPSVKSSKSFSITVKQLKKKPLPLTPTSAAAMADAMEAGILTNTSKNSSANVTPASATAIKHHHQKLLVSANKQLTRRATVSSQSYSKPASGLSTSASYHHLPKPSSISSSHSASSSTSSSSTALSQSSTESAATSVSSVSSAPPISFLSFSSKPKGNINNLTLPIGVSSALTSRFGGISIPLASPSCATQQFEYLHSYNSYYSSSNKKIDSYGFNKLGFAPSPYSPFSKFKPHNGSVSSLVSISIDPKDTTTQHKQPRYAYNNHKQEEDLWDPELHFDKEDSVDALFGKSKGFVVYV